jgi:hypothetical protein
MSAPLLRGRNRQLYDGRACVQGLQGSSTISECQCRNPDYQADG